MVYGYHDDGAWKFGIKDRGKFNGHKISLKSKDPQLGVATIPARYPI